MLIIITGATGTGKSDVAIELAKLINGEIISADSMQVYRGMDIGTNKTLPAQQQGIKHYLIDILNPGEEYSAARFKYDAESAIKTIEKKGKTPVICGGTGLYISVLLYGLFEAPKISEEIKKQVRQLLDEKGKEGLLEFIQKKDPKALSAIDKNNPRRLIRAAEVLMSGAEKFSDLKKEAARNAYKGEYAIFVLKTRRGELYKKINSRVEQMVENGLEKETRELLSLKLDKNSTAMQAIGYKETAWYLEGAMPKDEAIEKIKQATRNYAKRQETWFKRYKDAQAIEIAGLTAGQIANEIAKNQG